MWRFLADWFLISIIAGECWALLNIRRENGQ